MLIKCTPITQRSCTARKRKDSPSSEVLHATASLGNERGQGHEGALSEQTSSENALHNLVAMNGD